MKRPQIKKESSRKNPILSLKSRNFLGCGLLFRYKFSFEHAQFFIDHVNLYHDDKDYCHMKDTLEAPDVLFHVSYSVL